MLGCDDIKKEVDDPPVLVKMEVDSDEENDVDTTKVENEPIRGSFVPEKLEENMHQCVYCNVFLQRVEMRPVTKNYVALGIWCRKLGDNFRNRIETAINPFMCLSHFHDNYYDKTNYAQDVAVPISMDEKKDDASTCCAYCYKMCLTDSMFLVPSGVIRNMWIEELGPRFQENLRRMSFPFVCKSHIRDYERVVMPIPDEFIMQLEEREEKTRDSSFSLCAYCSKPGPKYDMVIVPLDEEIIEKWSNVLGVGFDYNAIRTVEPRICKSHFKKVDFDADGELIDGALPMGQEGLTTKPSKSPKCPCTYCGKMNHWRNLRLVVKCPRRRKVWTQILGKEFETNCQNDILPTICRSHFHVFTLNNGRRYYGKTPTVWRKVGNTLEMELEEASIRAKAEIGSFFDFFMNLYRFGWNTTEEMSKFNARVAEENHDGSFVRLSATKCIFCYAFVPNVFCSHKVFPGVRVFDEYAKVFGLQYKNRLKNVEFGKMVKLKPCLRLCRSHLDDNMEAVPDKNRHYSVDELLDHNYADYNDFKYLLHK